MLENNPNLGKPDVNDTNDVENSDSSLDPSTALHTAEKEEEEKIIYKSSAEQNQGMGNDDLDKGTSQQDLPGNKEKGEESEEKKGTDAAIETSTQGEANATADGEAASSEESTEGSGDSSWL